MALSKRTAWDRAADTAAQPLSESNPTLFFPQAWLEDAAVYRPAAFGLDAARAQVQTYYAARGRNVSIDRIALTASTSEAYAHAFTLFCDPGEVVLAPTPSYPLFDSLADVAGVRLQPYPLFYADGWHLDRVALERMETHAARALIVVSPNNPTGHYVTQSDWAWLNGYARARSLSLIVDEVFADYALDIPPDAERFVTSAEVTCLTLSGLSKVAALPQLKLGWMVFSGPHDEARARMEILLDTFLSVSTPAQLALPRALASDTPRLIHQRCRDNLALLKRIFAGSAVSVLRCEGGWCALLQTDQTMPAQDGALFGITHAPTRVVSLLLEPSTLAAAAEHCAAAANARR